MKNFLYFLRWQLYPVLRSLPAHLRFVTRGAGGTVKPRDRSGLAWRCLRIHLGVRCGHNPEEALRIVEAIIELPAGTPGVLVECGAFQGGSTAKLSLAAELAGRDLIVCDSFQGLPEVAGRDHDDGKPDFATGQYAGQLALVTRNVTRWGAIDRVRFVPGWYDESLARLEGTPIALAFWDVDLRASFMSCLRALWPQVIPGGKVFLHDVDRRPVMDLFYDAGWWHTAMGSDPPELVGGGTGLGRLSPLLGYIVKR